MNGQLGVFNRQLEWVVPPRYSLTREVGIAGPGRIWFWDGNLTGLMDETGKVIAEPQFVDQLEFHDGLAVARRENMAAYGYVDRDGKWVVEPTLTFASDFHGGLAVVAKGDDRMWVIDKTGKQLFEVRGRIPHVNVRQAGYSAGRLVTYDGDACLVYDPAGRVVFQRPHLYAFSDVCAWTWDEKMSQMYLIDVDGKRVTSDTFDSTMRRDMTDGMAAVRVGTDWGFVNAAGKLVVKPAYTEVQPFRDGLALVTTKSGQRVYVNDRGKQVFDYDR